MNTYNGHFDNVDGHDIRVIIKTKADTSNNIQIQLGETPVTIEQNSDDLFSPVKPYSATITISTYDLYPDMYTGEAHQSTVEVKDITSNKVLFYGYVTPYLYNQDYEYLNDIELECISPISTLQYYKYYDSYSSTKVSSFYDIIKRCLQKSEYYTTFYFPDNYGIATSEHDTTGFLYDYYLLKDISLNEYNFVDDDEEHQVADCRSILEKICRYFGISLVEHNGELWFVDYNQLNESGSTVKYVKYDITNDTSQRMNITPVTTSLTKDIYYDGSGNISYDETYNKISCSCNTYEIENDDVDIFDKEYGLVAYTNRTEENVEQFPSSDNGKLVSLGIYDGVYFIYNSIKEGKYKDPYYIWLKYYKNDSHLQTFMYSRPTSTNDRGSLITKPDEVKYSDTINYRGAVIMKSDQKEIEHENNTYQSRVSSISMSDIILINCYREKSQFTMNQIKLNGDTDGNKVSIDGYYPTQKVLTYKDILKYNDDGNDKYIIIDFDGVYHNKITRPFPTGGLSDGNNTQADNRFLWIELKVGDYYLTGWREDFAFVGDQNDIYNSNYQWTKTVAPDGSRKNKGRLYWVSKDDYIGEDMKLCTNIDWSMGLSKSSGVAFKLPDDVKYGDEIQFSIFMPHSPNSSNEQDYLFLKNFSVAVEEPDITSISGDKNDSDIVYTNLTVSLELNNDIVEEYEDLELDINTQCSDRSPSYSSVIDNDGYNAYLYDRTIKILQPQEYNLIYKYYNHYSSPKIKFTAVLDIANTRPIDRIRDNSLSKSMLIDSFTFDVRNNSHEINTIEY